MQKGDFFTYENNMLPWIPLANACRVWSLNPNLKFKTILKRITTTTESSVPWSDFNFPKVCSKTLLDSSTLRRPFLSRYGVSYMLHIPNSAKGNCLTEKENHTLCLKSDIKSINLRIIVRNSPAFDCHVFCFFSRPLVYGFWSNAHDQYTNPLARPLLIALQVVRTSFGFHLRECIRVSSSMVAQKNRKIGNSGLRK